MKKEFTFWKKFFFILLQIFAAGTLIPSLLLLWTILASGDLFNDTYFSKRLLANSLFYLPPPYVSWFSFSATFLIVMGIWKKEKSQWMRFAAYAGIVLLMTVIFLHLQIPSGIGVTLPLLILGSIALYTSNRPDPRKKLFPGRMIFAPFSRRFASFILLGMIVFATLFLYQEGTDYLLLRKDGFFMLLIPLAGCLLYSEKRLRDYLISTGAGFVLLAFLFCFTVAFADTLWIMDIAIIYLFIFLEYQILLLLRGFLPEIKNLSLIFLVLLLLANGKILPQIVDVNIVTLSVFVLYIFGDNFERCVKKIRRKLEPEKHLLERPSGELFAIQAWSISSFVLICFTGRSGISPFLFLTILLFLTGILKYLFLEKYRSCPETDHYEKWRKANLFLPLLPESAVILVFAFVLYFLGADTFLPAVIAAGNCGACIWNLGIVITGKDTRQLPFQASLYHASASGGIFLFMLLLFLYRVNSSFAASTGLILTGCTILGEGAYIRMNRRPGNGFFLRKWEAYICIALGLAFAAFPGGVLNAPHWELPAVSCGALAFFAVNVYYILKNKLRKQEDGYGRKQNQ